MSKGRNFKQKHSERQRSRKEQNTMTTRATIVRAKRTLTIGAMLVTLIGFVTLGIFRGPEGAQAYNPPPIAAQPYELPLRANDLAVGERFNTFVHEAGIQGEGKDIGVRRYI